VRGCKCKIIIQRKRRIKRTRMIACTTTFFAQQSFPVQSCILVPKQILGEREREESGDEWWPN
jgi:hypothetical protein